MKKKMTALAFGAVLAVSTLAGTAGANEGVGNGAEGCTLSNGAHYKNPSEMLKALTARDGHFQDTVNDLYPQYFDSVGDLIDQKCGA
jgi:hypothetical protein